MKIDLHMHTSPRSPCAVMEPAAAVAEAARLGLDAVCLTEHHLVWPRDELRRLEEDSGIRVFGGTEITTDQGDILVLGLDSDVEQVLSISELRRMVEAEGGFMIAAHPFRGFLLFGHGQLGLDPAHAAERPVFSYVDAIEVCNGRLTRSENDAAAEVARYIGLPGVGGSDAHRLDEIGHCVTVLEREVHDIAALASELRANACSVESVTSFDADQRMSDFSPDDS
jgi:predicted metal-dependent phosphoesterase TrpH